MLSKVTPQHGRTLEVGPAEGRSIPHEKFVARVIFTCKPLERDESTSDFIVKTRHAAQAVLQYSA